MFVLGLLVLGALLGGGGGAKTGAALQVGVPMGDSEATRRALERYANAMAENNADWARSEGEVPCCASCGGVTYVPPEECKGGGACQAVSDAETLLRRGRGTCFDIAAYDVGVLIAEGKDAFVKIVHQTDSDGEAVPYRYHAVVGVREAGDIQWSDPSEEIRTKGAVGCAA